jgi:hypothetical protein
MMMHLTLLIREAIVRSQLQLDFFFPEHTERSPVGPFLSSPASSPERAR